MTANRPQPRPGVLDIAPYIPGKSSAPGVAKVFKLSSNETPLGRERERHCRLSRGRRAPGGLSGRLGLGVARGDRRGFRARSRAHRLRRRLRRSAQPARARLSRRRRRGDPHHAWLSRLSDRHARHRGEAGRRAGEEFHRRRRRDPRARDAAHQDRVPGQPEQSDRDLYAVRRGQAPAPRAAGRCAVGARRGLRRICPPQRLRVRHRAGRHLRKRRDDAHLLEDLRARRAAPRLDVWAGACGRRDQPHPRAVQRQRAGDRRRHRGDPRHRACRALARAQCALARLAHRGDRQARPDGDAERRQFRAHPLSRDQGPAPPRTPTPS